MKDEPLSLGRAADVLRVALPDGKWLISTSRTTVPDPQTRNSVVVRRGAIATLAFS